MPHSFSYENELMRCTARPDDDDDDDDDDGDDEVLVQLDGERDGSSSAIYCSQCQLCNKTKETQREPEQKSNNNNVENNKIEKSSSGIRSDKAAAAENTVTPESRKTTASSRVAIDCDAIVAVPHCDDPTKSVTNGKNLSNQRSKRRKRGRQLLYSNGASSDLKDSSSQAGEKGSNDDEVRADCDA